MGKKIHLVASRWLEQLKSAQIPRVTSPLYYHGTSPEVCARIWEQGVAFESTRRLDAGDFGAGLYLTTNVPRARSYGKCLLAFLLDTRRYARISNPYFLVNGRSVWPTTRAERIFYAVAFDAHGRMRTVDRFYSADERRVFAERVRQAMLGAGYAGIVTAYQGDAVVFDLETIQAMSERS